MNKLLWAGIHRYLHSVLLWLAIAATVILSFLNAQRIRDWGLVDDVYPLGLWITTSIFISFMLGTQFSDRLFRNKLVIGYTKAQIYISEWILAVAMTCFLFLISTFTHAVIAPKALGAFSGIEFLRIMAGFLLFSIANSLLSLLISIFFSHKAAAPVICILLIFGMYWVTYTLEDELRRSEFTEVGIDLETGQVEILEEPIPNPRYVSGIKRDIYQFAFDVIPHAQSYRMVKILYQYVYCNHYPELTPDITEDDIRFLNTNFLYSIAFIFAISAVGYLHFGKKEFN